MVGYQSRLSSLTMKQGKNEEISKRDESPPLRLCVEDKHQRGILKAPRQTVSAAHIFKAKPRHHNQKRKREPETHESVIDILEEQFNEIGGQIAKNGTWTFNEALDAHMKVLSSIKEKDRRTIEIVSNAISKLIPPLTPGPIEINSVKVDTQISKFLKTTNSIAESKQTISAEQENLEKYWKNWDAIQNEYHQLGKEIFGQESHSKKTVSFKKGFSKEMERLDLHYFSGISYLEEKIEKLDAHIINKMKTSEKSLDIVMKKDRAKLLTSLVSDL